VIDHFGAIKYEKVGSQRNGARNIRQSQYPYKAHNQELTGGDIGHEMAIVIATQIHICNI